MLIYILQCLSQFSEDHPYWTSVFTIIFSAHVAKFIKNRKFRIPPGPTGLPFVGYLPFLNLRTLHTQLMELQKTYGTVFSLQLGSRLAVILADFKSMKESNVKDEFSARPPKMYKLSNKVKHFADMNEKDWKESNRFTLSSLNTLGMGNNKVEEVIQGNISRLLDQFGCSTGKTEINVHSHLYQLIADTIIKIVCGKTSSENAIYLPATLVHFSDQVLEYFETHSLAFFIPFLSPLINLFHPKVKTVRKELETMEWIIRKQIESHEKAFQETNLDDYMDFFIAEMRQRSKDSRSTFVPSVLNGNSQVLLVAGKDATLASIEWALLCLAKFPDVQEKAYRELVQVLGKESPITWAQRESLPYLTAVLMEVSRWKTVTPLSNLHWTLSEATINHYDIPKETYIINNIHAIHMDPTLWDKPEQFNPERFLFEEGTKCQPPEYLVPFSYGKRMCPGMKLANMATFLFVASILQRFRLQHPLSGLNMSGSLSFTYKPESPFLAVQARE